jgi:hypothetical protein
MFFGDFSQWPFAILRISYLQNWGFPFATLGISILQQTGIGNLLFYLMG